MDYELAPQWNVIILTAPIPLQHRVANQLQVIRRVIRRVTSGHLSAAADSKTSRRNPVMCIVLHLENIASLGRIFKL